MSIIGYSTAFYQGVPNYHLALQTQYYHHTPLSTFNCSPKTHLQVSYNTIKIALLDNTIIEVDARYLVAETDPLLGFLLGRDTFSPPS